MPTWISDKFAATGNQVLGIERDPLLNQIRACKAVPMNIHCHSCKNNWNPAFLPQSILHTDTSTSVTCPKCQCYGDLRTSSH
jgi:hypothetical protein